MFDRKRINDSKNSPVSNVTSFVPTLFLFRSHERIPCIRASFCERDVRTRAREMLWRIHRKNVAKMRDLPWTNEDRIVVITRKPWGQWEGVEWETAMSGSIEKACKRWKAVKFHSFVWEFLSPWSKAVYMPISRRSSTEPRKVSRQTGRTGLASLFNPLDIHANSCGNLGL